jgi:hypothetical protein
VARYFILTPDGKGVITRTESSSFENAAKDYTFTYMLHNTSKNPDSKPPSLPSSIIVAKDTWTGRIVAKRFVAYRAEAETYGYDKERYFECGPVHDTDMYWVNLAVREEIKRTSVPN